jgi:hypothetical protein
MNISFFDEPELEFGAGRHIDIRFGIMTYGPLDFSSSLAPKQINLGVVGSKESIEGVQQWLERCRVEIPAKRSKERPDRLSNQPNLFPRFPGFSADVCFQSTLLMPDTLCRDFQKRFHRAISVLSRTRPRFAALAPKLQVHKIFSNRNCNHRESHFGRSARRRASPIRLVFTENS